MYVFSNGKNKQYQGGLAVGGPLYYKEKSLYNQDVQKKKFKKT